MKPQRWSLGASILLLSVTMVGWNDLFLFAKTGIFPFWAKYLPNPVMAPAFIVFFLISPAILVADSLRNASKNATVAILVSPLPCLIIYAVKTENPWYLWFNLPFNYGWIVIFHCAVPATILIALRYICRLLCMSRQN